MVRISNHPGVRCNSKQAAKFPPIAPWHSGRLLVGYALGQWPALRGRLPSLRAQVVGALSLLPPGSIGVLHADLPGITLTNIDPYRVALPFKIHMIDFRDRAYLVFDILV